MSPSLVHPSSACGISLCCISGVITKQWRNKVSLFQRNQSWDFLIIITQSSSRTKLIQVAFALSATPPHPLHHPIRHPPPPSNWIVQYDETLID